MIPRACHPDDIALLAGGDLGPGPELDAVLAHVSACEACASLLGALEGDQATLARVASAPPTGPETESVVPVVLARLAVETLDARLAQEHRELRRSQRDVTGRSRRLTLSGFSRVAAAMALITAAGFLGVALLSHSGASSTVVDSGSSAQPLRPSELVAASTGVPAAAPTPVGRDAYEGGLTVRRTAGGALELSWQGDGREVAAPPRPVGTYRVLASSSPKDFSAARPVEVAGNRLVTNVDLPSLRTTDRSLTFFRVE